jgi:proline dehydrogenase
MEKQINLNNLRIAYRYKRSNELRFTYYIFLLLQRPKIVAMLSAVAAAVIKYHIPVKGFIRKTIFKVFCSGENITEALATIDKLDRYKVNAVLDYVSEAENNEQAFVKNKMIIVANIIRLGKKAPGNSVSVKLSGLEDPEFFKCINNVDSARSTAAESRYQTLLKRIDQICATAHAHNIIVYIDAEDRCMQDIFDHITELMMTKYNKQKAIVYNTLQMYLTDRLGYLNHLLADSQSKKYFPGIKLVRGAYVEKEREAAKLLGIKSPVFGTKAETDAAFNQGVRICLQNHDRVYTCIASHNEESTLLAIELIEELRISDHREKVKFSQLFGMSDNLSFNLAELGHNTSKYLPYGEVEKAIPYLIRRAEENSSIGGQMSGEVLRLKNELSRRSSTRLNTALR